MSGILLLSGLLAPQEKDPSGLLEGLRSESIAEREAAVAGLIAIGKPAVNPLRRALEEESDPEVRSRARHALDSIRLTMFTSRLLWIHHSFIDNCFVIREGPGPERRIPFEATDWRRPCNEWTLAADGKSLYYFSGSRLWARDLTAPKGSARQIGPPIAEAVPYLSPDGRRILLARGMECEVINLETGGLTPFPGIFYCNDPWMTAERLCSVDGSWKTVMVVNATSGKPCARYAFSPETFIGPVSGSPDGNRIAFFRREIEWREHVLTIWDAKSGSVLNLPCPVPFQDASLWSPGLWSPGGKKFAYSTGTSVCILDGETYRPLLEARGLTSCSLWIDDVLLVGLRHFEGGLQSVEDTYQILGVDTETGDCVPLTGESNRPFPRFQKTR